MQYTYISRMCKSGLTPNEFVDVCRKVTEYARLSSQG